MHGAKAFAARTSPQPSLREQGNGVPQRESPAHPGWAEEHQPPTTTHLKMDVQGVKCSWESEQGALL